MKQESAELGVGEIIEHDIGETFTPPPLQVVVGRAFPAVRRTGTAGTTRASPAGPVPYGRHPLPSASSLATTGTAPRDPVSQTRLPGAPSSGLTAFLQDAVETTVRVGQHLGRRETTTPHQWSPETFQRLSKGQYDTSEEAEGAGSALLPDSDPQKPLRGEAFLQEVVLLLRSSVKRHQEMGLEILLQHLLPTPISTSTSSAAEVTTAPASSSAGAGVQCGSLRGPGEAHALRLRLLQDMEEAFRQAEDTKEEGEEGSTPNVQFLSLLLTIYGASTRPYLCLLVVAVLNVLLHRLPCSQSRHSTSVPIRTGLYDMEEELEICRTTLGVDPPATPWCAFRRERTAEFRGSAGRLLSRSPSPLDWISLLFLQPSNNVSGSDGTRHPDVFRLCERLRVTAKLLGNAHVLLGKSESDEHLLCVPHRCREALLLQLLLASGAGISSSSSMSLVRESGRWFRNFVEERLSQWVLGEEEEVDVVEGKGDSDSDSDLKGLRRLVPLLLLLHRVAQHEEALHYLLFEDTANALLHPPPPQKSQKTEEMDDVYIPGAEPKISAAVKEQESEDFVSPSSSMKDMVELFFIRVCGLAPTTKEEGKGGAQAFFQASNSGDVTAIEIAFLWLRDFLGSNGEEEVHEAASVAGGEAKHKEHFRREHRTAHLMEVVSSLSDVLLEQGLQIGGGLVVEQWMRRAVQHFNQPEDHNAESSAALRLPPASLKTLFDESAALAVEGLLGNRTVRSHSMKKRPEWEVGHPPSSAPVAVAGSTGCAAWDWFLCTVHHQLLATYWEIVQGYAAVLHHSSHSSSTSPRSLKTPQSNNSVKWDVPAELHRRLREDWIRECFLGKPATPLSECNDQTDSSSTAALLSFHAGDYLERLQSPWLNPEAYATLPATWNCAPEASPQLRQALPFHADWMEGVRALQRLSISATEPRTSLLSQTTMERHEVSPLPPLQRLGLMQRLGLGLQASAASAQLRLLQVWVFEFPTLVEPSSSASRACGTAVWSKLSDLLTVWADRCVGLKNEVTTRLGHEELRTVTSAIAVWMALSDQQRHPTPASGRGAAASLRPLHVGCLFLLHGLTRATRGKEQLIPLALRGAFYGLEEWLPSEAHRTAASPDNTMEESSAAVWGILLEELQLGLRLRISALSTEGEGGTASIAVTGAPRSWLLAPFANYVAILQREEQEKAQGTANQEFVWTASQRQAYGRALQVWAKWVRYLFALDNRMKEVFDAAAVFAHLVSLYMEQPPTQRYGASAAVTVATSTPSPSSSLAEPVLSHEAHKEILHLMTALLSVCGGLGSEIGAGTTPGSSGCSGPPAGPHAHPRQPDDVRVFNGGKASFFFSPAAVRALTMALSSRAHPNQEEPLHPMVYLLLVVLVEQLVVMPPPARRESGDESADQLQHLVYLLLHTPVGLLDTDNEDHQPQEPELVMSAERQTFERLLEEVRSWRFRRPWRMSTSAGFPNTNWTIQYLQQVTPLYHSHLPPPLASPVLSPAYGDHERTTTTKENNFLDLFSVALQHPERGLCWFAIHELTHTILQAYLHAKHTAQCTKLVKSTTVALKEEKEEVAGAGAINSSSTTSSVACFRLSAFESGVWRRAMEELHWFPPEIVEVLREE